MAEQEAAEEDKAFSDATTVSFLGDHLEAPKSEHDFATKEQKEQTRVLRFPSPQIHHR